MPYFWHAEFESFINHLVAALPWLLGLGGTAAIIGYSRLGRALLSWSREQERANELSSELLQELALIKSSLGELTERLDATEHHLRSIAAGSPRRSALSEPRIPTPV